MKNLEIAGDITYFTINGDIYGIDATDGSAVECHDAESPAERIEHQDLIDALSGGLLLENPIDSTVEFESISWHFDGFDLVECIGHWEIEEHCYMNIPTGSVDTFSNWATEGFSPNENELLVRVAKDSSGEWVEV